MATFVVRKNRPKPYLAQIHRKGHPTFSKSFLTMAAARRWANEQERTLELAGLPQTFSELKKKTVADLATRYLDILAAERPNAESERIVLRSLLKRPVAKKSLAFISTQDAAEYRDQRLRETWRGRPIKPSTVRREINVLQAMFERARMEWGYPNLINPFRGVRITGGSTRRDYCPTPEQCEALINASNQCRHANKFYMPLAITLALETGMRLQEIMNLTWNDVDLDNRRITIRKSKMDYRTGKNGRIIVMTKAVRELLGFLKPIYNGHAHVRFVSGVPVLKASAKLFPMTKGAFKQARDGVWKRAGLSHLTFHDLRHAAASRFADAHLAPHEQRQIMGHSARDISESYIHATLASIQEKLDAHDEKQAKRNMEAALTAQRERLTKRRQLASRYPDGSASAGFSELNENDKRDVQRTIEESAVRAAKKEKADKRAVRRANLPYNPDDQAIIAA